MQNLLTECGLEHFYAKLCDEDLSYERLTLLVDTHASAGVRECVQNTLKNACGLTSG